MSLIYTELELYWDFVFEDCWQFSQSGIPAPLVPYLDNGFRRLYLVMLDIRAGGVDVDSISAFPISNRELGVIRLIASSHGYNCSLQVGCYMPLFSTNDRTH